MHSIPDPSTSVHPPGALALRLARQTRGARTRAVELRIPIVGTSAVARIRTRIDTADGSPVRVRLRGQGWGEEGPIEGEFRATYYAPCEVDGRPDVAAVEIFVLCMGGAWSTFGTRLLPEMPPDVVRVEAVGEPDAASILDAFSDADLIAALRSVS